MSRGARFYLLVVVGLCMQSYAMVMVLAAGNAGVDRLGTLDVPPAVHLFILIWHRNGHGRKSWLDDSLMCGGGGCMWFGSRIAWKTPA